LSLKISFNNLLILNFSVYSYYFNFSLLTDLPLDNNNVVAFRIRIEGLVQGVGFRPFIYRLASHYSLNGWVVNQTDGLSLKVEGPAAIMPYFIDDLRSKAPVASLIEAITIDPDLPEGLMNFSILASQDLTDETSEISPDIAVCSDCINDLTLQPHRVNYPFINCTNCGPRFSIIRDFPYDRGNTTMKPFTMCHTCEKEYTEILDRRFHAQPIACNSCGPHYTLHLGNQKIEEFSKILLQVIVLVSKGKIIAIKGIGGFHLMCDATNETAVNRLRKLKKREGKPFAVMFRDIESLREYAKVTEEEERALISWRRPIVILKSKKSLPREISIDLDTLGAFLPYMPFHHLFFRKSECIAVVLTSGNIAEEPIIIDNDKAKEKLTAIADAIVTYNRDIYNRTDDSVVRIIGNKERIHRRSRGYVPGPLIMPYNVDKILATGAELSNCFCLGKGNRAYLSQHIGDLKNHETYEFYIQTIQRFQQLFRVKPNLIAADMHPDYLSTRYARKFKLETVWIQHHHAHIASCMAENGLDERVIGLAFDGTGYGTDGNIWGSEFLVCDYNSFVRYAHFDYMPMPGGDRASEEPWRIGIALLYQAFEQSIFELNVPLIKSAGRHKISMITEAIDKKINCPMSSGAGRLFDAVSAITGICEYAMFHSEAPMRLESYIEPDIDQFYSFDINDNISFLPSIREICRDLMEGISMIATKFHNTIVESSLQIVKKIRIETGLQKVALSGGSFQNKYLLEFLESRLIKDNFSVYTHSKVPCNDGGIALGQLAIAAKKRSLVTGE
jgi:hydrogenase maturation protein HypF